MTIITNFVPYSFMFAALIRLKREPVESGVIRVPGGKPVATVLALVGMVTTFLVIVASVVPDPGEPNKFLAVAKVIFFSVLLIGGGMLLYAVGRRRPKAA
jgi:amino acid transporter